MVELLSRFSVEQILLYTAILCLAVKGAIDFFTWCYNQYKIKFNKDYEKINKENICEEHYQEGLEKYRELVARYEKINENIDALTETINTKITKIESQLEQLTISDMHDIKGWIVDKHHKLIKQGWVDDFTMDTLEKRFHDYKEEGGNSYIGGLMEEIRDLPHVTSKGEE